MSSIGSGPIGIPPLANSAAGAAGQLKPADANRAQHDGNIQRFQLDRAAQYEKAVGDIGASDGTDERDADGRMPWSQQRRNDAPPQGDGKPASSHHAPDLTSERGGQLDLDA